MASRKPLLLLDDVFSALDRATRDHISLELLGKNGLLRKLGTTAIYSTHNSEYSRVILRPWEHYCLTHPVYIGQIVRLADVILEIADVNGHRIVREVQQLPDDLDDDVNDETSEAPEACGPSTDAKKESDATNAAEVKRASEGADDREIVPSLSSPVRDREVYMRYFRAMGFGNAAIFMLFAAAFAITLKFPGR